MRPFVLHDYGLDIPPQAASRFSGTCDVASQTPGGVLAGATGLRFGCEYENPRDVVVRWGFGDQEMCDVFGFIEAPFLVEAQIDTAQPDGIDGTLQLFTGPCATVVVAR